METFYQICSAFIQYGEDENFLEGFDDSSMKEPPSLYTNNTHIQDSYDQQEDNIHPSIAGFPSHYRKVGFSDIQIYFSFYFFNSRGTHNHSYDREGTLPSKDFVLFLT